MHIQTNIGAHTMARAPQTFNPSHAIARARAKEKGALEIHVVTKFENNPAIQLYKKHGLTKESLQLEKEFK